MNDQAQFRSPNSAAAAPPAGDLRLRVAHLSDLGHVRDHQEDAVGVFAPDDPAVLARKGQLLMVADGMGGHQAGEVASRMAVAEVSRAYYADPGDDPATSLARAFQAANQAIYRQAQAAHDEQGMGTTVAAAVIRGRSVQLANIGDSRIYLLRGRAVTQLTEDHSWVAEQMRAGILTPEQAANHPQRNLVVRALGKREAVQPDFFSGELKAGDVLLLCSDGLTGHVRDEELAEIAGGNSPDVAVRRLVDLANSRGGSDNISVIVARLEGPEAVAPAAAPAAAPKAVRLPPRTIVIAIAALALLALIALLLALLLEREPSGEGPEPGESQPGATTALTPVLTVADVTSAPPTVTLAPTVEAASVEATGMLPAPTNLVIANASGANLINADQVQFTWRWDGQLPAGHAFEVRIWKGDSDPHLGAAESARERRDSGWTQTINVALAPAVRQGGEGLYHWTVAVVRTAPYERVGAEAAPGLFEYRSSQQPARANPVQTLLPSLPGLPTPPIRRP